MKRQIALAFLISIFTLSFIPTSQAATLPPGTTQGQFAIWLVKQAGAMTRLPTAASAQDAIDFLRSIGVVPKNGWDIDKEVDDEFLRSFLGDDASGTTEELLQKIQNMVEGLLNNADVHSGVFPVGGASGSSPA